jgi:acetyl esterase/lipase
MFSLQHLQYACIRAIINTSLYVRRSPWMSPATQPDRIKMYAYRPDLFPSRIFTPRTHAGQQLPLVVCVHGGGFILNNPAVDDPLARHLADTSNCIVVSIDYRKSPQNKFPMAYDDVVELSLAVMDDPDLPLDRSRVVLCGSSAGGNLVLAAAQHPRLRHRLTGVVALYPLCDLVPSAEEKMATRPDPSIPDFLGDSYSSVGSLYMDESKNIPLTDIRLSPTYFASRDHLPLNVFLVGCEHDMLCHEAETMSNRIAAMTNAAKVETRAGWQAGGVRWHKVEGQTHAFEHFPAKSADKEKVRIAARDATYSMLSEWLANVFSSSSSVQSLRE